MPELTTLLAPFQPALQVLAEHAAAQQCTVWVVGGTLRDALVGRPIHDVDLAVAGAADQLARTLADALGAAFVPLDEERAVARVVLGDGAVLDFARLRAPTLAEDVQARDFTANALAAPLLADGSVGPLIDVVGGQADIAAGVLRLCSPSSFADDPLRMLRATRLASQLGWTLDPALDAALRTAAPRIGAISAERVRDELLALLATRWSAPWLRYLDRAGVLAVLLPELGPTHGETQPIIHFLDVWEHTLEAICCGEWMLDQLADAGLSRPPAPPADHADPYPPAFFNHPVAARRYPELRAELQWSAKVLEHMQRPLAGQHSHIALWKLALLLHDIAKPITRADKPEGGVSFYGHQDIGADMARTIGQRLRLSRAEVDYIATVVRGHMRPGQLNDLGEITPRAAYRFFRDLEPAAVDTLLHSLADHLATRGPNLSPPHWAIHLAWTDAMLGFHWDAAREQQKRAPLLDGHTLMRELNLAAGPQVGELLEAIREAHAAGEISSSDDALALARRLQA
jgi:poly(A) polymerase/tRNA nucleotidyltransferase (CCA-adding enzyme)